MPPAAGPLRVDISNRVAVLTLNRPEKLNALSDEMIRSASATLERCATDREGVAAFLEKREPRFRGR